MLHLQYNITMDVDKISSLSQIFQRKGLELHTNLPVNLRCSNQIREMRYRSQTYSSHSFESSDIALDMLVHPDNYCLRFLLRSQNTYC